MIESKTADQTALVVQGGPTDGEVIPLLDRTTMGRQSGNDVLVADLGVSRQHAAILKTEDGYSLRDLSSSNG